MSITTTVFGNTSDGAPVTKYALSNRQGSRVSLMDWGAAILEVEVPDRSGKIENVNLVFDSLAGYLKPHPGFGSTIGRFCNRIAYGQFPIDGVPIQVTVNHGKHCLHGGKINFSHCNWSGEIVAPDCVRFTLVSPDGDEGFPGELTVSAEYCWNDDSELTLEYTATTTATTVVNLTNHSYWNLGGAGSRTVLEHVATMDAGEVLAVDSDLIPTGERVKVENTAFDFRSPRTIGERIDSLAASKGYDHCYVLPGEPGELRTAARVLDPKSGRGLEVETTQPGVQLYTGNHLRGDAASNGYGKHDAFCLETQHFPDSPNHPSFPSTVLRPGETFRQKTVHRFTVSPHTNE